MKSKLTLLFLLSIIPFISFAGDKTVNFKVGRGIAHSEYSTYYGLSGQEYFWHIFTQQLEVGGYTGGNYSSSGLLSYSIGLHLNSEKAYIEALSGIAGITTTDELLGSRFEFQHDVGVGLQNDALISAGIGYKHISNAGISEKNTGRDYIYFKLGLPFQW